MIDKKLIEEIKYTFGPSSDQIIEKFNEYSKRREWVSHSKVIAAILKLSEGDVSKIDEYINKAKVDPRDVVMYADEK
jgi:hypothetical protein